MGLDGDWERLGTLVTHWRDVELGITQQQAVDRARGEVSLSVWRAVEKAWRPPFRRAGLVAICRVLGWSPRSIEEILAGGDPIPAGDDDGEPFDVRAALAQAQALLDQIASHVDQTR